jgi:hypothetical protein
MREIAEALMALAVEKITELERVAAQLNRDGGGVNKALNAVLVGLL